MPSEMDMKAFGGITYTPFGLILTPDLTSSTGIAVAFAMISVSMLSWLGSSCCTSTNAIPVSDDSAWKKSLYASSPPAEAPNRHDRKSPAISNGVFVGRTLLGGGSGFGKPGFHRLSRASTHSSREVLSSLLDAANRKVPLIAPFTLSSSTEASLWDPTPGIPSAADD